MTPRVKDRAQVSVRDRLIGELPDDVKAATADFEVHRPESRLGQ